MATYIQVINRVLRRLREDEVASPTSSAYSTLIGDMVNEAKREVEDAWNWHALRTSIDVTTAADTNGYPIVGAGKRFRFIDDERKAYHSNNIGWIRPGDPATLKRSLRTDTSTGLPMRYYIQGIDSNGDPLVYFYSEPDGVYTISFELVVPQVDLSDGATEISVPDDPIFRGAYAKAIAERGEDNGTTFDTALAAYERSLGDATAIDSVLSEFEDEWMVK